VEEEITIAAAAVSKEDICTPLYINTNMMQAATTLTLCSFVRHHLRYLQHDNITSILCITFILYLPVPISCVGGSGAYGDDLAGMCCAPYRGTGASSLRDGYGLTLVGALWPRPCYFCALMCGRLPDSLHAFDQSFRINQRSTIQVTGIKRFLF
jgi:hypothetical protein